MFLFLCQESSAFLSSLQCASMEMCYLTTKKVSSEFTSQRPPFRHEAWQLLFPVDLVIFNKISSVQTNSETKILAHEFLYYAFKVTFFR